MSTSPFSRPRRGNPEHRALRLSPPRRRVDFLLPRLSLGTQPSEARQPQAATVLWLTQESFSLLHLPGGADGWIYVLLPFPFENEIPCVNLSVHPPERGREDDGGLRSVIMI